MRRDVIPNTSKMLYDTAKVDHRNSENLEEKEIPGHQLNINVKFSCVIFNSARILEKFLNFNITMQ